MTSAVLTVPAASHLPPLQAPRGAFSETHDRWPFQECLCYLITQQLTGRLTLHPSGVTLHLNGGKLDAVQGDRALGAVLLEQGLVHEEALRTALTAGGLLGQTLLRMRVLTALQLRTALRLQARAALPRVLGSRPERYDFAPGLPLPVPSAAIPGGDVLAEALTAQGTLPLDSVFQLAGVVQPVTVTSEAWALLRWVNGRRSLQRVVHLSGLEAEAAQVAVRQLIEQELIEQGAISGLKFIVPRIKPASNVRQPPAGIRGNLFLRHLDGVQDVWTVIQKLNFPQEEAVSLLTSMYRDDVLDIVHGRQEFQRLLEQY
ncbi:hypothetical protein [Deinococcus koreensis]|uniref:DUF4388 domain-containing protein n=1 Tax=Deinococcus koreensis TaxID=2054903 RepID=A0A2K3UTJ0_9DEIO|nr:hypothetical protein [Deinococcus koreensis]PNY79849.1 hypothetical protein CVO96_18085 [Deinococcus koreensis]